MLVKLHNSYRNIVALCDKNLLGRKLEEGKKQLDLTGGFFNGEEKSIEELKKIILHAKLDDAIFNVVGEKSCNLLISLNLIKQNEVKTIQGIPIAMVLM